MLDPFFFQLPPDVDAPALSSGLSIKVIGYAQSQNYTRVVFAYGDENEYSTIECLYRDRILLASGSGALSLGFDRAPAQFRNAKAGETDLDTIQASIDANANPYGIPLSIAKGLTAPGSYISFIP